MDAILLGAGGQAKDVIKNIGEYNAAVPRRERINLLGCVDDVNKTPAGAELAGYPVLSSMKIFEKKAFRAARVLCAVGDPAGKKAFIDKAERYGLKFFNLIHPSVNVDKSCVLGTGISVFSNSAISGFCRIGSHVSINYLCSINHDCELGDLVTLAPGVNIGGSCVIKEGSFLGINSCVINDIKIGQWSVVGAGTTVIKEVEPHAIVAGNPQRVIGKRDKNTPII